MKNLKFYRVQNSNGTSPSLAPAEFTLSQLYNQIKKQRPAHTNFLIYYHFKPYSQQEHGAQKLSKIIANDPMHQPKFIIYETIDDGVCPILQKYGEGMAESQKLEQQKSSGIQKKKQYSVGQNGTIIFENRATSLLASSVNHAVTAQQYKQKKKQIVQNFNMTVMHQENNKKNQKPDQGIIKRFLTRIGLIKSDPSSKNLLNTIQTLKSIQSNQDLKQHQNRQYSDYDPKFATYLQSIYIKYAILNGYRLHYIEYKNMQDGIIKYRFPSNAKIAIIGDYGTGLSDSFGLLRHAIIQKESDIIIHLGDVYYAGTPNQYRDHVVKPLNQLRKQAGLKFKKNVLFYSIPGNHDYYSWGMPFLTFIANINEVKEITIQKKQNSEQASQNLTSQISSYFCLRSEDNKWQFIGLDTAYHDSNPTNQINGFSLGPRLRQKEVQWFNDKMQTFPGSTILLTHHQLISIHDRLEGSLSQYKRFSCVNPLLSAQLFKYLPSISGWFWGHQHSIMFFDKDIFGVRKCRLLGNSSFHVFQKQGPYLRKPGFPTIPLIQQDQQYIHKYLPINPDAQNNNNDAYFNLSYALIDFSKQTNTKFPLDSFSSTIPVQYYCTPCYPQQNASKQHFSPYLMYKQQFQPRIPTTLIQNLKENLAKQEKQIKNQEQLLSSLDVVGNVQYISENSQIYIKTQIGLYVDTGIKLSLTGINFKITIQKLQVNSILNENQTQLSQQQAQKQIKMKQIKQEVPLNQKEELIPKPKNNNIQKINKIHKLLQDGDIVYFRQNFKMQKIPLAQTKTKTKLQEKQQQKEILSKQPKLQLLSSVDLTNQQLPPIAEDLVQQTVLNFIQNILSQKRYVIKKYPILNDTSPKIKYGDAFSLKQITSGQYLTCSIGRFGSILKLKELKKNQQTSLFMFLKQSKVKCAK